MAPTSARVLRGISRKIKWLGGGGGASLNHKVSIKPHSRHIPGNTSIMLMLMLIAGYLMF